ncbi:N-acetylglucosamine-6-phosphate deacetylase [Loktanella sp. DSM 29012]|uniref:N-acetylglucosamine-6-phosphate deacetylase n=1 Tax=Loktanella sp. DSM 29012 TaxID=1881056 RepID=UPI0008C4E38B|nr:N-acetylglucosamine-6-phosphate deacetylase [Loktanella sp. DSM 29012]SEQ03726.1 N-acetylglucosamine-6-phosphate deacetylase [Loktanella sp. DSM 29012]
MLIAPDLLWESGRGMTGMGVTLAGGLVTHIAPLAGATPDLRVAVLMPGCTDLQVNGGGGVLFNNDPTVDGLERIVAAHQTRGTAEVMATVITDHPDVTETAAQAVIAARTMPGLLGLHIEGPHIALARRGTHDPDAIRPLDARTVDLIAQLRAHDIPVMLTLAPECSDAGLMEQVSATGAILSAGHSDATAPQTAAALDAGITCFTHLFNAMPPMTSRAPGIVGAALRSEAYCGLIADGIHVDWDMIRIAMAARPVADRMFLVSDAMATVGGPDEFDLYGRTIRVADGALINAEGALAGAHLDMVTACANIHHHAGVSVAQAIRMATDIPRTVMGLRPRSIVLETPVRDLLALDMDMQRIILPDQ